MRKLVITMERFKTTPHKVRYNETDAVIADSEPGGYHAQLGPDIEASGAFYIRQDVLHTLAGTNEYPKTLKLTVEVE